MRAEYDIFERFPDGSSVWRATVPGKFEAQRRMQEFAEHSENACFTIDIRADEHIAFPMPARSPRPLARAAAS